VYVALSLYGYADYLPFVFSLYEWKLFAGVVLFTLRGHGVSLCVPFSPSRAESDSLYGDACGCSLCVLLFTVISFSCIALPLGDCASDVFPMCVLSLYG
jgi:hypothetical protein